MIRHALFWVTLGVAGLWYWDRQHHASLQRGQALQQAPFFSAPQRNAKGQVAGMVLQGAAGERFEYFRQQGVWRVDTAEGVLAEEADILSFWHAMADAVARPVSLDPERVGLHPRPRWTVSFHGRGMRRTPGGDVLFRVELGDASGPRGVFARVGPQGPVHQLSTHPLGSWRQGDPLPPFADRHVVPSAWPTSRAPLSVLRLVVDGRLVWELRPETEAQGWILEADGGRRALPEARVRSWLSWLRALEGTDPSREDPQGLAAAARHVLVLRTGPEEGLEVRWNEARDARVRVSFPGLVLGVDAAALPWLAPTLETWFATGPWPWDPEPPADGRNR